VMGVRRSWVGVLSCAAIAGCGGHSLDIGSNDGGGVADTESPPLLPIGPSPDASSVTEQVWIGHLVNHQLPDGSDALTMTLDFAPGGQVTGSLLFGDGTLLQPPTDPNVGYPPGNTGAATLVEGFPYTILNGILNGSRFTFHVSEYEPWTQWCALQTSYLVASASDSGAPALYQCIPNQNTEFGPTGCNFYDPLDGALSPVDCGKLWFCGAPGGGVCQCLATGCGVFSSASPLFSLDLVLAKTTANGTMSGDFGDYQVQLTRSR